MKKVNNFKICILFLTGIISTCCETNPYQTEKDLLVNICKPIEHSYSLERKLYIVTSFDGCNACLQETIKFIEQNIENNDMIFIVSGRSKVQLRARFKPQTVKHKNFVLDSNMYAIKNKLVQSAFPRVYLCKKGDIVEAFEVNSVTAPERFHYATTFVKNN